MPSQQREAIAAVFDLTGFTNFCKQVDPHLCVPTFLSEFLKWLFKEIRADLVQKSYKKKLLFTDLPFLAKFLGDGVLFLWNSKGMEDFEICNVVVSLRHVCSKYKREFYPKMKKICGSSSRALQPFEDRAGIPNICGKSDNWRIAQEMTKEELDETDLGQFLASI